MTALRQTADVIADSLQAWLAQVLALCHEPQRCVTVRLVAAFEAVAALRGDLVIWEHDEPEAPTTLVLWASARRLQAERHGGDANPVLSVRTSPTREIRVYLEIGAAARKAG